jgi:Antibiotic biosynthesis monooxygenase
VEVGMLVVTRFDVPVEDGDAFLAQAKHALGMLAAQSGYRSGTIGRAADQPTAWVMATQWDGVGTYRRALSAFDVRTTLMPLTVQAVDEPGAYEVLDVQAARPRPVDAGPRGPKLAG